MSPLVQTNRAAVLHGAADIRLETRTVFKPPRSCALVRILATGLCGSDLHYYTDGRNGDFALRAPLVLGHEAAGVVEAVGAACVDPYGRPLRVGTLVAVEAGIPCCKAPATVSMTAHSQQDPSSSKSKDACTYCASGRYNLCKDLRFASSAKTFPHLDGTLQEKMVHPGSLLWPLPDSVSPTLGALAEPLSVVLHASRRAQLLLHPRSLAASPSPSSTSTSPSSSPSPSLNTPTSLNNGLSGIAPSAVRQQDILILGAGTIGLAAAALAQAYGARSVVCVDINRRRLEFAKAEGFVDDYFVLSRDAPATSQTTSTTTPTSTTQTSQSSSTTQTTPAQNASTLALERGKERAAAALKHFNQPDGFDIVYECTGAEACIQMAVHAATTGGKILLVGMGTRNITLPLSAAALREVDILGSFRYAGTYAEVLRLLGVFAENPRSSSTQSSTSDSSESTSPSTQSSTTSIAGEGVVGEGRAGGVVGGEGGPRKTLPDLTKLVTHTFALEDTQKAFEMMRAGVDASGGMVMKVVIQ